MAMIETWGWAGPAATKETWAAPAVETGLQSRRESGNSGTYTRTPSGMNIDTGSHTCMVKFGWLWVCSGLWLWVLSGHGMVGILGQGV